MRCLQVGERWDAMRGWEKFIVSALKEDVQMMWGRKLLEHAVFALRQPFGEHVINYSKLIFP